MPCVQIRNNCSIYTSTSCINTYITFFIHTKSNIFLIFHSGGCHCHDHMVVRFTTTCAISVYCHKSFDIESCSWQGVLDTTLCDKVCQWLVTGRSVVFCRYFGFLHQKNWLPWYNWNIVESVENSPNFHYILNWNLIHR